MRLVLFIACFVAASVGLTASPNLIIYPNPVQSGSPFSLAIYAPNEDLACDITFNSTKVLASGDQLTLKANQPLSTPITALVTCINHTLDIYANLSCTYVEDFSDDATTTPKPPLRESSVHKIKVETGAQITISKLHATSSDSDKIELAVHLETASLVPVKKLTCELAWNDTDVSWDTDAETQQKISFIPNYGEKETSKWQPVKCNNTNTRSTCDLKSDVMGHSEIELKVGFTRHDSAGLSTNLTVRCSADCLQANDSVLTPAPQIRFQASSSEVLAGNNFNITAIPGREEAEATHCNLTLPDKGVQLAPPTQCTAVNDTVYDCEFKSQKTLTIHVDANKKPGEEEFNFQCSPHGGHSYSSPAQVVQVKRSNNMTVALEFVTIDKQKLNMSIIVTNPGPSDVQQLRCTVFTAPALPEPSFPTQDKNCTTGDTNQTCTFEFGNMTTANKTYIVSWAITKAFLNVSSEFSIECTSIDNVDKPVTTTKWVNGTTVEDKKQPAQPESYFWTYTIVIVNLFLIALVVFVGMWWRNRAIARSMEGGAVHGGDRLHEMELFSSSASLDGRPLSKAD